MFFISKNNILLKGQTVMECVVMQQITTNSPNNDQLKVGLTEFKVCFGNKLKKHQDKTLKAEAIG